MSEQALCWINGNIVPPEQATVSVFDHGLLYGDGIFEGIRFYNQKPFHLNLHLKRLQNSARALQLELGYNTQEMEQAILSLIQQSHLQAGYLRLIITRGIGALGIDPKHCQQPNTIIIADELSMVDDTKRVKGIRTIIASTRRSTPDRLDPRIKSLNYLNSILAKIEANYSGVEEAILLNDRGCLAEGSVDNLFIVKERTLLTPAVTEGALAGITRLSLLQLAQKLGIPAQETSLTPYDLYTADECFLTGTGAKLIPVREVDGRTIKYCPGATYQRLSIAFNELIKQETA